MIKTIEMRPENPPNTEGGMHSTEVHVLSNSGGFAQFETFGTKSAGLF